MGKRGKCARRARQGQLGIPSLGKSKKRSRQFAKLEDKRQQDKEEKRDIEELKAKVRGNAVDEKAAKEPHSFVIHTGKVGRYVRRLERDIRRVMEPNTASQLKVTKRNNFKDFMVNAAPLGVSHMVVLTKSDQSVNLRIIRTPQGPTLRFRGIASNPGMPLIRKFPVENYTLMRDILAASKRAVIFQEQFRKSPLVVLSGFNQPEKKHLGLVQTVIQNMFPSINVDTVKLSTIRRTVLVHYNAEEDLIEFRHYAIKSVPSGISKSAKKLVQSKIPDLSKYEDISQFMLAPGQLSESEFEGEQVEVDLAQDLATRGCKKGQKTKIRLLEIGPRMTWKLMKVEEGVDEGEVLYHSYIKKSAKEIMKLRALVPQIRKRRLRHEKNVEHAVIRKLQSREERQKEEEKEFNEEKSKIIQKQNAVTGNTANDDRAAKEEQALQQKRPANDDEDSKPNVKKEPLKKRPKK
ncbi:brix domain-containing protein [Aphelenchoides avenae]|nr:brix domain-containing protein [Aphelenchus avenae]